jgi:hypothetical protein
VETTSEKSSGSFLPKKKLCIVDLNINLFKINKNNFLLNYTYQFLFSLSLLEFFLMETLSSMIASHAPVAATLLRTDDVVVSGTPEQAAADATANNTKTSDPANVGTPNHTLYIKNLNERVKLPGKIVIHALYTSNIRDIHVLSPCHSIENFIGNFIRTVWRTS